MKLKFTVVCFVLPLYIFSQSFIVTTNNDTIYGKILSNTDDYLIYTEPNNDVEIKLEVEKVKGYQILSTYYHKKVFKTTNWTGFLGLKKKTGNYFDFVRLIFEGRIKAYVGTTFYVGQGNYRRQKNYWFLEKDDEIEIAFMADNDSGAFSLGKIKYYDLNVELFKSVFSDDEKALEVINTLKKRGKLNEIRTLVNDYNNRHHDKTAESKEISSSYMASVTFLRDSRKELKDDLKLMVNNRSYHFPKNSKLKLKIPSDRLTKICIENSENKYCRLVSSSQSFQNFYKLILDKHDLGDVFKVYGLSNFYQVRLKHYKNVD